MKIEFNKEQVKIIQELVGDELFGIRMMANPAQAELKDYRKELHDMLTQVAAAEVQKAINNAEEAARYINTNCDTKIIRGNQ
jgi:hypothetical protein